MDYWQKRSRKKRRIPHGNANQEYRRSHAYTDTLEYDEPVAVRRPRPTPEIADQERNATDLKAGRHPRLVIARRLNLHALHAGDNSWADFFDKIDEQNPQKGQVMDLGHVACEFVGAAALDRMLQDRYPKAYQERKSAADIQNKFAKDFREFVRSQEKQSVDAQFDLATTPHLHTNGVVENTFAIPVETEHWAAGYVGTPAESELLEQETYPIWSGAGFLVRGIEVDSVNNALALDLQANDDLYEENEGIRDYLRHKKLNLDLIPGPGEERRVFQPTADFYRVSGDIGAISLYLPERPDFLPLHPPAAYRP